MDLWSGGLSLKLLRLMNTQLEKNCRLFKLKEKHNMLTTQEIKASITSSFIFSKGLVKL